MIINNSSTICCFKMNNCDSDRPLLLWRRGLFFISKPLPENVLNRICNAVEQATKEVVQELAGTSVGDQDPAVAHLKSNEPFFSLHSSCLLPNVQLLPEIVMRVQPAGEAVMREEIAGAQSETSLNDKAAVTFTKDEITPSLAYSVDLNKAKENQNGEVYRETNKRSKKSESEVKVRFQSWLMIRTFEPQEYIKDYKDQRVNCKLEEYEEEDVEHYMNAKSNKYVENKNESQKPLSCKPSPVSLQCEDVNQCASYEDSYLQAQLQYEAYCNGEFENMQVVSTLRRLPNIESDYEGRTFNGITLSNEKTSENEALVDDKEENFNCLDSMEANEQAMPLDFNNVENLPEPKDINYKLTTSLDVMKNFLLEDCEYVPTDFSPEPEAQTPKENNQDTSLDAIAVKNNMNEANINISRVVRPIYLHLTDSKDESDAVSMKDEEAIRNEKNEEKANEDLPDDYIVNNLPKNDNNLEPSRHEPSFALHLPAGADINQYVKNYVKKQQQKKGQWEATDLIQEK